MTAKMKLCILMLAIIMIAVMLFACGEPVTMTDNVEPTPMPTSTPIPVKNYSNNQVEAGIRAGQQYGAECTRNGNCESEGD